MKNDKRSYTIRVTKSGNTYATELREGGKTIGSTQKLSFDKNKDGMRKTDFYTLNFEIENVDLSDEDKVIFAPANQDVLWVWTDISQCPTAGNYMEDTLWVDKNTNGKNLRVINMDLKKQDLRFQINMVKKKDPAARPFIELDPIVGNGNGGSGEPLYAAAVIACALTGALVGFGAAELSAQGFVEQNALLYGIGGALIGALVGLFVGRR